jgi:hypothetical protein
MMNYDLAREDFVNMGEVMLRNIYDVKHILYYHFIYLVQYEMARVLVVLYWVECREEDI